MFINELKPNQPVDSIVLEIVNKGETKEFTNFRGKVSVANAKVKDSTGECTLTLWNDEIERYSAGQKIRIINGWCKEYRGEVQVSSGKYGKIEVLAGGSAQPEEKAVPKAPKKAAAKAPRKKTGKTGTGEEEEEETAAVDDDIFAEAEKDPYLKYEKIYGKGGKEEL
jgi:replication factor A1